MSEPFSESLDRLLFHLDNQTGFWFALVVADDPSPRARLREAAEQWCKEHGAAFFTQAPAPEGLVPLVIELAKGQQPGLHWIRADGAKGTAEQWDAGAAQLFMAMNERREAFRRRHVGGVVVEGRLSLKPLLRDLAPDLFSIRAFVAEPGEVEEQDEVAHFDAPAWQWPDVSSFHVNDVDPDLILQQIARLEARTEPEVAAKRLDLRVRAVLVLVNANRFEDASTAADALEMDVGRGADVTAPQRQVARIVVLHARGAHAAARGDHGRSLECVNELIDVIACIPMLPLSRGQIFATRATILVKMHDERGAIRDFEKAIECEEADFQSRPKDASLRGDFVRHSEKLADRHISSFAPGEAIRVLEHALKRLDEWQREKPNELRWHYERCRLELTLGLAHLQSLDISAMRDAFRRAASIAERCARRAPGDRDIEQTKHTVYMVRAVGHAVHRDLSNEAVDVYLQALRDVVFPWMQRATRQQIRRVVLDLLIRVMAGIERFTKAAAHRRPPAPPISPDAASASRTPPKSP